MQEEVPMPKRMRRESKCPVEVEIPTNSLTLVKCESQVQMRGESKIECDEALVKIPGVEAEQRDDLRRCSLVKEGVGWEAHRSVAQMTKLRGKVNATPRPRGNRPSLQTGELDKTVIFSLSTLSVLCDNDDVVSAGRALLRQRRWECQVEIELPVPDTLPTSAKVSDQTPVRGWSCILSLSMLKCFVRLFYKPSDVRAASYVCWEGSAGIVRGDDVCSIHAVFQAKTAGAPGGGVMPPRTSRRRRQNQDGTQDPTQGQSESGSSTPRGQNEAGREQFARSAQEIGRPKKAEPSDREKMYEIERLKKLEATVFDGSTDPADAETFIGIFEEKYYPTTYCEAKRDEFLELKQGLLSVAEYERKYTELLQYAEMIVASESDRCRRFKRGLRFEICTPLTAIAKWTNFSQLVETALRVEQSIVKEKSAMELSRGVLTTSGIRGREQRRFTLGVNVLGCQDFKRRSGGKPLRLFYKPSDVRVASYVCWEGSVGIVRADDVCWLHAVLQAKTAGGPGGGMTYPPQRVMFSGEERKGGDKAKLKSCFTLQEILKVFKAQGMSFAKRQVKELFRLLGVHPSSCEEVYDGCQGSMPPYGYME
ncbi:uncharacterized protein E5676_scaffold325G00500 [Cucumis melo var. makuwa]|uniref:Retrotransposon gag domain-containing protein n=1 Tax=Cucumis melo var. makuwa TaxID=1194695 RepID=A0A5D3DV36_CUCMM|nr:uncharacterized protein E5676_scaffold325G00500 [Cucumis melo var. makuwa]